MRRRIIAVTALAAISTFAATDASARQKPQGYAEWGHTYVQPQRVERRKVPRKKVVKVVRHDPALALLRRQAAQIEQMAQELAAIRKILRPDVAAVDPVPVPPPRNPVLAAPMPMPDTTIAGYAKTIAKSAKLADLTPGLAAKAREILGACNTKITSGYRRGARIAGSGRPSLHSTYPSQAVDLVGDPKCIYARLKNWPGGYSVDYAAVRHVHVSLSSSGRERGARFVHYRGGPSRYAMRTRYAVAR